MTLQKQNKIASNSLVNVAGTPVSVAVRAGAPKPDIGSVEAFKQTLLTARSIVYADPAKGGVSGVVARPRFRTAKTRSGHLQQVGARRELRGAPCRGRQLWIPTDLASGRNVRFSILVVAGVAP
jgi:Bacterial extracellular solute-binding protein